MHTVTPALIITLVLSIGLGHAHHGASGADSDPPATLVSTADGRPAHEPTAAPRADDRPAVQITGAGATDVAVVESAVGAYAAHGLALPDLEFHFHDSSDGCNGHQGRYRQVGDRNIVDLCQVNEFLVLHEIGHAWTRVNLDDRARDRFVELTGLPSWAGADDAWHKRGIEVAANALAHGLLSEPLRPGGERARELDQFRVLTGRASSRTVAPIDGDVELTDDERQTRRDFAAWRLGSAGAERPASNSG